MKRILTTPLADLSDLQIGDVIYLTGTLVTGRDDVHRRIVREDLPCPMDLRGLALMHAGPIVRESGPQPELISIGPTSSVRMEDYEAEFLARTGVKLLIGKGGMGDATARACRELGAVHCVYPGGCAVAGAAQTEALEGVFWRDLGMPEALWVLKVRAFGPLIVSIDTRGRNLFAENKAFYVAQKEQILPIMQKKL